MKKLFFLAPLVLAGCSSLPEATGQVRLSQGSGVVEGGYPLVLGGSVQGTTCILSVLGAIPERLSATLEQGECKAELKGVE